MTGFGRARRTVGGRDITVEIRSVNSRYLDCSVRLSRSVSFLEERIKPYLQARGLARGKVDISITVETLESEDVVALDDGKVKAYLAALSRLRDEYGLRDDISVMTVARNADLFVTVKPEEDAERDWADLEPVLAEAADLFFAAKEREGAALVLDLGAKLGDLRKTVEEVARMSEDTVQHYRERLAERVRLALADNHITPDESRILTECAITVPGWKPSSGRCWPIPPSTRAVFSRKRPSFPTRWRWTKNWSGCARISTRWQRFCGTATRLAGGWIS